MRSGHRTWWRWVWLAGLMGLVGLHFWFPPVRTRHANDTLSVGEEGKKAFFLLVEEEAGSAVRNLKPLTRFVEDEYGGGTLCVLGAGREPNKEEWDALFSWVASGGTLLYAFPFETFIRPVALGEDRRERIEIPQIDVAVQLAEVGVEFGLFGAVDTEVHEIETELVDDTSKLIWRAAAEIEPGTAEVLLTIDGSVQAVRKRYGAGTVVVVATDEPFTNYELVVGDRGVMGYRLLETAGMGRRVHFDESLNDSSTPKLVGVLLEPDIRPLTLQLVLLVYVFCWWGHERFGPTLPERTPAQQDVVGHSDALGTLVHQSGDGQGALRTYYRQLLGDLGLGGAGSKVRANRVLGPIARRLGVEVDRVQEVLDEAGEAAENARLNRREAARQIRRLAKIRQAADVRGMTARDPGETN